MSSRKPKSIKRNVILNIIKQISAILFPLVTIPYITRVLGSENYGKVNFSNTVVSYFAMIAALGIVNYTVREAPPIRDDEKKFEKFASEVFSINVLSSAIAYVLLAAAMFVPKLANYRELCLIYSFSILFTTCGADWINNIFEDFEYLTIRFIIVQFLALIAMFVFVRDRGDYPVYALIMMLANTGANALNIFHARRYVKLRFTWHLNAKKHMKPLLLLFANVVAITIYINSDTVLLGFMKSDSSVGIYSLVSRIYISVKQVLNAAIMVMVPRLALYLTNKDEEKFRNLLNTLLNFILCLLLPTLTGLIMISDMAVIVAGGAEYAEGYHALQILGLSLFPAVLACFFSNGILLPAKQDKLFLKSTIAGACVNIGLNFILIPLLDYNGAALTTLLGETTVLLMVYRGSRRIIRCRVSRDTMLSTILGCAAIVSICLMARQLISRTLYAAAAAIVISIAAYAVILAIFNKTVFDYLVYRKIEVPEIGK